MPEMPNRLSLSLAACALLALLSACGGDAPDEGDGRAVSGEVLEGTISDAMLPLDTVQSQAPRAEPEAVPGQPQGEAGVPVEEAGAAAEGTADGDTPAASEEAAEAP